MRERLAVNFDAWVAAVERCFVDTGPRLPTEVDRRALAVVALTTMEGGVDARTVSSAVTGAIGGRSG